VSSRIRSSCPGLTLSSVAASPREIARATLR